MFFFSIVILSAKSFISNLYNINLLKFDMKISDLTDNLYLATTTRDR